MRAPAASPVRDRALGASRCDQVPLAPAGAASPSMARVNTSPEMPRPLSAASSIATMTVLRTRSLLISTDSLAVLGMVSALDLGAFSRP
ncbi:hypothetical protein GCM10027440_38230 [Nocardiopsis coralliicola]